jgi:tetratricopeptide (TPR) repeat protein
MSTLREFEQALERDPTLDEPFLALRKAYREGSVWDKLITLYEMRAQALPDPVKASDLFYLAAEVRLDHMDDAEGAEADLAHALDRSPENIKAAARLKLIYRQAGRHSEYMAVLELEAAAVASTREPARIAELETELAQFCRDGLGRLEKAVTLPAQQRAAEVTPEGLKLIESARKIYRALGHFQEVVRLYELELALVSEAKRRCDLLLGLGRVLGEKLGDLESAAQRFSEVVRLRPRDDKALEALAAIYAHPRWPSSDGDAKSGSGGAGGGRERAAATYHQIARRRHEAGDIDNAVAALRKALAAVPGHPEASELIEQILFGAGRLGDLDLYYRERVGEARSLDEKMDFLFKRAQLAEGHRQDMAEAQRIYEEISGIEPPGGPASLRLGQIYAAAQDWARLAELRERQLATVQDPAFRLAVLTELAVLYRDRLGDPEQAAVSWHAILEVDPNNQEAFTAYADHFRQRGEWASLIDLLEFSFEHARGAGRPVDELVTRLEEIAVTAERHLGDSERALLSWQRMDELSPGHDRAREAQKRILQKGKQWERMITVLEREASTAPEQAEKVESLRRLARVLTEKLTDTERAAGVYRQILALEPKDPVAQRALIDLCERDGKWADLAQLLRAQLEGQTQKPERLATLRRLLALYQDQIGDATEGSWAAAEVLKLAPGDRDALERLEGILEKSAAPDRLIETLEYHCRHATASEEKLRLAVRIAGIAQDQLGDSARALTWWEEVLRLAPGDSTALAALASGYEALGKHAEHAHVLELQVAAAARDPALESAALRKLARLCSNDQALNDQARGQRAWEDLLRRYPSDPEALEALSRIYAANSDWHTLVGILERRIPLAADNAAAVALALERARIFEEELRINSEAMATLDRIVEELDPRCAPAFERLRRLAEAVGDWNRVVQVAEKQIFLTDDPSDKALRAQEVGAILRDRLDDPKRAMAAFERAVEVDPYSFNALTALATLYAEGGEWQRLILTDERLLELLPHDEGERRRLMFEIADTAELRLGDPRLAFDWCRRAHNEGLGEEVLPRLEALAERHKLWDPMIEVYEGARAKATAPAAQVALSSKIAHLVEEALGDPGRALGVLREALASEPDGRTLVPEIERLAAISHDWAILLDVYAQVARARPEIEERLALLRLRAEVREKRLHDRGAALDEQLRAFALAPDDEMTRQEISRLAEATGRWEDAIGVESQRFARATTTAAKVEIACRAAALVEEKLQDPKRAFLAYLNAFRLSPDDETIVAHLWRLAAVVDSDARSEAATVEDLPEDLLEELNELDDGPDTGARQAAGIELVTDTGVDVSNAVKDALDAAAAKDEARKAAGATPLDDDISDLPTDVTQERATVPRHQGTTGREPKEVTVELDIVAGAVVAGSVVVGRRPTAPATPRPTTGIELSPWSEFARAYEQLPAADKQVRHRYLRCIAEIWERGAHDITRALATLERAFGLDTDDAAVRADLERLAAREGRWDEVCNIFARAAEQAPRLTASRLYHDVARFHEALGRRADAEKAYQTILVLDGDDQIAQDRLEESLRSNERWADLASLLEKRVSHAQERSAASVDVGGSADREPRRRRALELAGLYDLRLERPYEAIDTYERFLVDADEDLRGGDDPHLIATAADALEALVRLHGRVAMWPKAVQALRREIELVTDRDRLRALRMRLGELEEKELGQPEAALAAYRGIIVDFPEDDEALQALDRLCESLGRHDELQEIVGRRAARATGAERAALIKRQARILESDLGNADAAAACLRTLAAEGALDDETSAALLRNLGRAGLAHEALRLLSQRIELYTSERRPPALVADLHLEMAALQLDRLNDPTAAHQAIDRALSLVPNHGAALAALAKLYLGQNNFAAYARARVRQAEALAGQEGAAGAWLEAGRVYRDQLSDPSEARRCFERAVAEAPQDAETLRALAAVLASEGKLPEARELYERLIRLLDDPTAKAAVLTDLARCLWEKPGDGPIAVARLDEALALSPDYLPAVVTMADLYYREHQWAEAERRLLQAIRRSKGEPGEIAQLYHRLGEVYDKLGRLDEGYRHLQEAERMMPGQLLIRLALGENRFQAKKWREAALHLEGIVEHPQAHRFPLEVAEGLAHAAQAEVRLKRPERAFVLYQGALRLCPDHQPALRALAELALGRGEPAEAAQYLKRLAEGGGDRIERARLYEQLGDIQAGIGDAENARQAYSEAITLTGPLDETHVPLLEKALAQHRAVAALQPAAEVATLLIGLMKDPALRASRRREAALLLEEQGDFGKAGELLEQALGEDPRNEAVLGSVVTAYERARRKTELEAVLTSTLGNLDPVADDLRARTRRAELWEKLGDLRRRRNKEGAIAALETAVSIEAERITARAALAKLYGDKQEYAQAALENHRLLAMTDLGRDDSLRTLARSHASKGEIDRARCCIELLDLFGLTKRDDKAFLAAHLPPARRPEDPYAIALDDGERASRLAHPEARVMAEVFAAIWEGVPGLGQVTLESLGLTPLDKVSPIADVTIAQIFGQIAKALDNRRASLYVSPKAEIEGPLLLVPPPPSIVVGPKLIDAEPAVLRFFLGRALELCRPEYILASALPAAEFNQLLGSLLKAFHPRHARWRSGEAGVASEQAAKLKKALPYKVAKRLAELFQENETQPFSSVRWRTVVEETGNRAGLLMCGDLATAARAVFQESNPGVEPDAEAYLVAAAKPGPLRELLRFSISDACFALREVLGTSVPRAAAA